MGNTINVPAVVESTEKIENEVVRLQTLLANLRNVADVFSSAWSSDESEKVKRCIVDMTNDIENMKTYINNVQAKVKEFAKTTSSVNTVNVNNV